MGRMKQTVEPGSGDGDHEVGAGRDGKQDAIEEAVVSGVGRATCEQESVCLDDDGGVGVGRVGDMHEVDDDEDSSAGGGRRVVIVVAASALGAGGDMVGTGNGSAQGARNLGRGLAEAPSPRSDEGKGFGSHATEAAELPQVEDGNEAAAKEMSIETSLPTGSDQNDRLCASSQVRAPRRPTAAASVAAAGATSVINGVRSDGEARPSTDVHRARSDERVALPGAWQMPGLFRRRNDGDRGSDRPAPLRPNGAGEGLSQPLAAQIVISEDRLRRGSSPGPSRRCSHVSSLVSSSGITVLEEIIEGMPVRGQSHEDDKNSEGPCSGWGFLGRHRWPLGFFALLVAVVIAVAVPLSVTRSRIRTDSPEGPPSDSLGQPESEGLDRFSSIKAALLTLPALPDGSAAALDDETSPQRRALKWIADEDARQLVWAEETKLLQRFVVATLFFATGGGEGLWFEDCNFLSAEHECEWHCTENITGPVVEADDGVLKLHLVPGHNYSYIGLRCFEDNATVDGIRLHDNNLTGALPEEIGALATLEYAEISTNPGLFGQIPQSIGRLKELRALILHSNSMTGTISSSFGSLSQLRDLSLGFNRFHGTIPSEVNNLGTLENLLLSKRMADPSLPLFETNSFSGQLPFKAGTLPNLRVLEIVGRHHGDASGISRVGLSSTIPSTLCTFSNLRVLNLRYNALTGSLPPCLGNLTHLRELMAHTNSLTGGIPRSIWSLVQLEALSLAFNNLSGGLSGEVAKLRNLQFLHLASNNLSNELPANFGEGLGQLRDLYLYDNGFFGTLPSSVGEIVKLRTLGLFLNKFSGTLPDSMGSLTELVSLSLHTNQFSGQVPKSMDGIKSLKWILLSSNSFTGDVTFMCESSNKPWMSADCHHGKGDSPEARCDCCAFCCSDVDEGPLTWDDLFYGTYKSVGITGLDHGCYLT